MKKLLLLPILALALFVGMAVGPGKAVADGCAASFATVQDAAACGGDIWVWYAHESSPPGGPAVGSYTSYCSSQQAYWITYTWSADGAYRYTVQCLRAY